VGTAGFTETKEDAMTVRRRRGRDSKGPYYLRGDVENEMKYHPESYDTTGREQATKTKPKRRTARRASGNEG
jgi:hypothetical protein